MPEPVTVAVLVPPAVPVSVTSPVAKLVVASLKTTVKLIGLALVGSAWPPAWLIVTVGATLSQVTVLSVEVEARLASAPALWATPAAKVAITVPPVVMPETATLYVIPLPVTVAVVAPAPPARVTSPVAKSATLSLNTTVKLIGDVPVGSAWPAAWLIVTVGCAASATVGTNRLPMSVTPRSTALRRRDPMELGDLGVMWRFLPFGAARQRSHYAPA